MNDREAAGLLGLFTAAWPQVDVSQQTAQLWIGMLERCEPEAAKTAALTVIRNDHWFPSIARFLQSYEAEAQRRAGQRADRFGLPRPRNVGVAPPKRLVEAARALLAEMGGKDHWHGGPDPCPKCGGTPPMWLSTSRRHKKPEPRPATGTPVRGCGIKGCLTCYSKENA